MASSRKFHLVNLTDYVAAQIAPLIPAQSSVLVGLSGGIDSVVLLHLLNKISSRFSWQIKAMHVHHGISQNADTWSEFCSRLCNSLQIPLLVERVNIAPIREQGIEAAARKLRHSALAGQDCDFVALAHHSDDQAETLLLQLLRGAGVRGASAMPQISSRPGSSTLVRPLLHCTRKEIFDYATFNQLEWVEDESNLDDRHPRNFLRNRVFPLLAEKFPSYRNTLMRSTHHFAEANELLNDLAHQDSSGMVVGRTIAIESLSLLDPARAKNVLRYFLHVNELPMPQAIQLDEIIQQLLFAKHDAGVCINYCGWQFRRFQGKAYLLDTLNDFDRNLVLPWQGERVLDWPALNCRLIFENGKQMQPRNQLGFRLSLAKLQHAPVTIRLRKGGERLRLFPKGPSKSLKNLMQEHLIPPWHRDRLPLLYCGDELVCVPGVAISAEYLPDYEERAIQIELQGAQIGNS